MTAETLAEMTCPECGAAVAVDLVGVEEVARIAGIEPRSVRKYVQRGLLPQPVPVAGAQRPPLIWPRHTIEQWDQQRPGPGRPPVDHDQTPPAQATSST